MPIVFALIRLLHVCACKGVLAYLNPPKGGGGEESNTKAVSALLLPSWLPVYPLHPSSP
jgi:hypothetical protein